MNDPLKDDNDMILEYQKSMNPRIAGKLVNRYTPTLNKFIGKYQSSSNLPKEIVRSYGKKFMISALKTYDPNKGASFDTHFNRNLQQINRVNYETSGVFRMSEELQMGAKKYQGSFDELRDKYGREPSAAEIADDLGWTISKVERVARQSFKSVPESTLTFDPNVSYGKDSRLDYIYHDLSDNDRIIMQHKTGYGGSPIMNNKQIAKKLKLSEASISQKSLKIAKKIKDVMGI